MAMPEETNRLELRAGSDRGPSPVRDRREIIREERWMRRLILPLLSKGPMTIPELASALGRPAHEVVYWVMGLRKYGELAEVKDSGDDGYFRYELAGEEA